MSKEKKVSFNLIDVLIIIGFVLIIGGFCFYAMGNWQTNHDDKSPVTVKYTLQATNIAPEVANLISVGDELFDTAKDTSKGKIIAVKYNKHYVNEDAFDSETGEYWRDQHPVNRSVEFVVESSYSLNGETVMIDDTEIKISKKYHLKTTDYALYAYCTKIEK